MTKGLDSTKLLPGIVVVVLVLFAAIWLWICWQIWSFAPTAEQPQLPLPTAVVTTAGYLATTVGTATAAVLGLTVATVALQTQDRTVGTLSTAAASRVKDDLMLVLAVAVYFAIGVVILVTWVVRSDVAPELVSTFALSILGWAGGAVSAVLRAPTAPSG